jgi:hypothetical protein
MLVLGVLFFIVVLSAILYLNYKSDSISVDEDYVVPENLFHVPSRLKFESSSFSDDYVTPYFYYNGWKPLLRVERPMLDTQDYEIEKIVYNLGNGKFDYEKKRWATVGDCLKHNHEVRLELEKKRKESKEEKLRQENRKREAYKRANS